MASVCRAQNPATCRTHGMGSPVERLELDKAKAIRSGDYRTQYEIQQKIDKYKDDSPEEITAKASFFGEMNWKLFKKMRLEYLDTKTEELGHVLNRNKVFGKATERWQQTEIHNLQDMVRGHVKTGESNYLELNYPSFVRLAIHTAVDGKGNAYVQNIEAYEYSSGNKNIDYDTLNREVRSVFNLTTPEKPKNENPDVEMVPCGTCSVCDPAPSDITHFGGWTSNECERPVPKQ